MKYCQAVLVQIFLFLFLFLFGAYEKAEARDLSFKRNYRFKKAKIDVVIPCAAKDKPTLELCIEGIKKYGKGINRVIVVSEKRYSKSAEWFDEKKFPFTRLDLARAIFGDEEKAKQFLATSRPSMNWIYQQFLKLYTLFVIPKISPNVLILDSDTVFLRPVEFLHKGRYAFFNPGTEHHLPYFAFMERAIPGLTRVFPNHSGISHHMLLQREILKDLFVTIKKQHKGVIWKSLCRCIDVNHLYNSCMSEYELYFNFAFSRTKKLKIRKLRWQNVSSLRAIERLRKKGYHFASCHSYLRKNRAKKA